MTHQMPTNPPSSTSKNPDTPTTQTNPQQNIGGRTSLRLRIRMGLTAAKRAILPSNTSKFSTKLTTKFAIKRPSKLPGRQTANVTAKRVINFNKGPWKQITHVAVVPTLTVLLAFIIWAFTPHPTIPADFRQLPQSLQAVTKIGPGTTSSQGQAGEAGQSGRSDGSGESGSNSSRSGSGSGDGSGSGSGSGSKSDSGSPSSGTSSKSAGTLLSLGAGGLFSSGGSGSGSGADLGILGAEDTAPVAPGATEADTTGSNANANAVRSNHPKMLVSLGDSITFGFGLKGSKPGHPSSQAYPGLVARAEGMNVTNLGVTSWSSADLLHALGTPKFQSALTKANLVTIDIGSNDLLHASYNLLAPNATLPPKDAVLNNPIFQQAISEYVNQLQQIIQTVQGQTGAPIILINLYDPFPDGSSLHDVAEQLITRANQAIWTIAAQDGLPVIDAYKAINHHQATAVRLNELDIHPTPHGQAKLAALVEKAIEKPRQFVPSIYAVSDAGTLVYRDPANSSTIMGWVRGTTGVLVTGVQNNDLQVQLPNGQTGYVDKRNVTLLTRPWSSDVQFGTLNTTVTPGSLIGYELGKSTLSADGFVWNGTIYVPLDVIASVSGSTVESDTSTRTVDLTTPMHSGLIQGSWGLANLNGAGSGALAGPKPTSGGAATGGTGAAVGRGATGTGSAAGTGGTGGTSGAGKAGGAGGGATNAGDSAPVPTSGSSYTGSEYAGNAALASSQLNLVFSTSDGLEKATLVTSGWQLQIDGQPTQLGHSIVAKNGVLYVPAKSLWLALGGSVTHGTGGLLTLSANDS